MICVFEDNPDADISVLFKSGYSLDVAAKFIYSKGNGNLVDKVKEHLRSTTEQIVVFMDTIPGNKDCHTIYRRLCKLSRDNDYRVIVMPIVCAEYYFIASIKNERLFNDVQERDACIRKRPHLLSQLMECDDKARFCKNFEKYCKYILKYGTAKYCLKSYNPISAVNGEYYRMDCICNNSDGICKQETLIQKSFDLLEEYPCIPAGSKMENVRILSGDDVWNLHRRLVDDYNDFSDSYKKVDTNTCNCYKHINYIK